MPLIQPVDSGKARRLRPQAGSSTTYKSAAEKGLSALGMVLRMALSIACLLVFAYAANEVLSGDMRHLVPLALSLVVQCVLVVESDI